MDKFFRWLLGDKEKATKAIDTANTAPLTEEQLKTIITEHNPQYELQQLIAAVGQSVGKQRELNEDSVLAVTTTMAGNSGNPNREPQRRESDNVHSSPHDAEFTGWRYG